MKYNHYNFLMQLQSNLQKLYEIFGYKPERITLTPPSDIIQHLESFFDSGRMANYLDSVNIQIKNAVKAADNLRIDNWSLKEELEECKKRVAELESGVAASTGNLDSDKVCTDTAKGNDVGLNTELIKSIISLYDNQIIKRDFIKQQASTDDSALRVVESSIKEIEALLKNNGVEIIDSKGEFSGKTQMIVDTKDTDLPELAGSVCDTVRVGFRYGDELLRAQEVIVYTPKENG